VVCFFLRLERRGVGRLTGGFFGLLRTFVRDFVADFFAGLGVAFFARSVGFATAFFFRFADGLDRDFFATLDGDFFDARFFVGVGAGHVKNIDVNAACQFCRHSLDNFLPQNVRRGD
jgi:hypothetical protein